MLLLSLIGFLGLFYSKDYGVLITSAINQIKVIQNKAYQ